MGPPGAGVDDFSRLVENVPNRRVRLEVRFRPIGVGHVTLELDDDEPGRTRVTMTEDLHQGPLAVLWSKPVDGLISLRNACSLQRLARLSEQRARLKPS